MRFCVSVPVLSLAMQVVEPNVWRRVEAMVKMVKMMKMVKMVKRARMVECEVETVTRWKKRRMKWRVKGLRLMRTLVMCYIHKHMVVFHNLN